ncbi:MAG TPA: LD-carboxypeptidase [Firmicutes bacterium]|nr:LD-carboxypeptidase [Bacillota bacterium]
MKTKQNSFILPDPLKEGDIIGLPAPAGIVSKNVVNRVVRIFKENGFTNLILPDISRTFRYFAADDKSRADDFNRMIEARNVKAIIALRGGYGSVRILNDVNISELIKKRIIFCGYSDISLFHTLIFNSRKLISFYGPMPGIDFSLKNMNSIKGFFNFLKNFSRNDITYSFKNDLKLKKAEFSGTAFASCLTLLQTTAGTEYQPNLSGSILFLEDVNEESYRVDRMLHHLLHSGILSGVKIIVFCLKGSESETGDLNEILDEISVKTGIHIIRGFRFGHLSPFNIIPIGSVCKVEIKGNKILLNFLLR